MRSRFVGAVPCQKASVPRTVRLVRPECLAEALDNRLEWGVWGGMTERERRRLLRERPDVTSWRDVLLADQGSQPKTARVKL